MMRIFEVEHSNFCHTALVYNDDGDEVDEHGNIQWVLSLKKSLQDREYMIKTIKLGLPKAVRVVSLVLKFINNLRKQSDDFDVRTVEPRALLNYVDPHFIGMQNLGKDSLRTVHWKKSLQTARVALDSLIQHGVTTTLNTISSENQLMINDKGFLASNWLI